MSAFPRRLSPDSLRLLVLTDHALARPRDPVDVVAAAIRGGATAVQLRMKGASASELRDIGAELRRITHEARVLLYVNDRADVAVAIGADGVHVGPNDPAVVDLRRVYGPGLRIGASTDDPETARRLEAEGADYLGCGAVFGTTTKDVGGEAIGPERLAAVAAAVSIPVVGIGGIGPGNIARLAGTGAAGVAVVGAVMAAPDPESAARELRSAVDRFGTFPAPPRPDSPVS